MPIYEIEVNGHVFEIDSPSPPTRELVARITGQRRPAPQDEQPMLAGVAKGLGQSVAGAVLGAGEVMARPMRQIPGVRDYVATPEQFEQAREWLATPETGAETVGKVGGDVAQFFLPTGAAGKLRTAAEIGKAAGLTTLQGGTAGESAVAAGAAAVIPGAGAVRKVGQALGASAEPLVRAAIKPTVTSLRRISGGQGLDAKANALVRFIIDNKLTTADKARTLFQDAENQLQRLLLASPRPTDAATRAERYLLALERSASKQGLGADDVKLIRQAADDLLAGPMGQTVTGPAGAARVLRADVPAKEALDSARASSRWTTRKQWGEQKGATMEAAKAVERAQRDAVKQAVPGAKELLQTEGKALQSAEVLDRMAQRAANRDAVSLPAHVIAAGELASGKVPVLAFAANWLRNNQMKAGIWADELGKAIQAGNAPRAAEILKKLGVAGVSQAAQASPATP